jgi:microcystin-dependent protein
MPTVPLLGNVADLASSQAAQVTVPLMPTGSVISYAGSTAPSGWLLCDGAPLSTTTYASLFAIIGYTFGGSGGTFNLPDLRGRFVRYDDNMGNHGIAGVTAAGAAARDSGRSHGSAQTQTTAKNGMTVSSSNFTPVGSVPSGGSHGHDHVAFANYSYNGDSRVFLGGGGANSALNTGQNGSTQSTMPLQVTSGGSSHAHSFTGTSGAVSTSLGTGDTETRPINIALNAIIKI